MSILIKGMEMPKNCCECFAFKSTPSGHLFCRAKRIAFGEEDAEWLPLHTPNWCPLVSVPPHGRLIDDVEIVRCKDCKYCDKVDDYEYWCNGRGFPKGLVTPDGFCDKGRKRG